jgi:hypothetical protein
LPQAIDDHGIPAASVTARVPGSGAVVSRAAITSAGSPGAIEFRLLSRAVGRTVT